MEKISLWDFAAAISAGDLSPIAALTDDDGDGQRFFAPDDLEDIAVLSWGNRFDLETMRLEDLPGIAVTAEAGRRREFDHLSTGQQHSVLLSLLLCTLGVAQHRPESNHLVST